MTVIGHITVPYQIIAHYTLAKVNYNLKYQVMIQQTDIKILKTKPILRKYLFKFPPFFSTPLHFTGMYASGNERANIYQADPFF